MLPGLAEAELTEAAARPGSAVLMPALIQHPVSALIRCLSLRVSTHTSTPPTNYPERSKL